jgi:hypothetical protein
MIMIKLFTWLKTYFNHMESQCLVDFTNFIKINNHLNHLKIYFHLLICCNVHCFYTNIF